MKTVRVIIEYRRENSAQSEMRWERSSTLGKEGTFELLGRAFEVAQREEGAAFADSLRAFFRGAMVHKEDLAPILPKLE